MTAVAAIVAPIFALLILGAAARHWRILDAPGARGINDLTFFLGIPALLFSAVTDAPSLRVLDTASLYFGGCLLTFAAGTLLSRRFLGASLAQAAMAGLNASFGNTVILGVPLVTATFGPDGLAIMLPVIALHSVLLLPLATILIEADGKPGSNPIRILAASLPALLHNPIIVAILVALAWRALAIPIPGPLHTLLAMLSQAAPTLALFGLGATLPDFAAQGDLREAGLATTLKLVVQPLIIWALAHLVGLPPLPTAVLVLTAGTPTGANAFFLARRTLTATASSAGTVVAATTLSILTLSAWLAVLR